MRAPSSTRVLAAALTFAATALLLLVAAGAAHAALWVIPATDRAFPDTQPGVTQAIAIEAAQNEYEGAQVVLGGGGERLVSFSWGAGSDPLITQNTVLDQVYYVNVTTPTTGLRAGPGLYPDPLVPKAFGAQLTVPDQTTAFYLLTHVPPGTPGGDYSATLVVQEGAELHEVPFTLHVWRFGWVRLTTRTGFTVNTNAIGRSLAGSGLDWTDADARRRVVLATYDMLSQHGISSLAPLEQPTPALDGSFDNAAFASALAPYLDGLGLTATRIPWVRTAPWVLDNAYGPSSPQLMTYLTQLASVYKQYGWQHKAYAYIMDETTTRAEEKTAELYARVLHAASARSGYRLAFLLTDDPRPTDLGGVKQANTFLFDDVDIWGVRYFYFFGRIPALRQEQAAGKQVWWYPYYNGQVAKLPNFVIEKPNTDQRVWGWLMEQWRVDGLINWALNRWVSATTPSNYRDPYQEPLTWSTSARQANGDSSLIYPGYYPAYGLTDPYAPPVSSLRLEALRDGLEDREYLRLAKMLPGGAQLAARQLATITQFPYPVEQKNVFRFPTYSDDPLVYERARHALAQFIETPQMVAAGAAPLAARALPGSQAVLALQDAELRDGQPDPYEDFGCAVALDGDTALVGAGYKTVGGQPYAGAANVYVRSGAGWSLQATLTDPAPSAGDGFGGAVALHGDTALVGADDRTVNGRDHAGAAYVYVRSGGVWSLHAELTAASAAENDWFGASVALDGDTALVGAGGRTVGGQYYAGAAFVFTRSGGVWSLQAELTADDAAPGDEFGYAVALSGETALVGAENKLVGSAAGAGAAYVFARSGADWSLQAELTAPDAAYRAGFGSSLDLSGDTALIGAGGAPVGGRLNAGAAYVYVRSGLTWSQQAEITDPDVAAGDWFGSSLALSGDRALIGAWGATVGGKSEAGAAYVCGRSGAGWMQLGKAVASNAAYGDNFGTSVGVSGDTVLAGAPRKKVSGQPLAGAAYTFQLVPAPSVSLAAWPTSTRRGRPVTLSGEVASAVAGASLVAIQRRVEGRLVLLKQLRLSGGGSFSWTMPVAKAGKQVLVATYAAGGVSFQSAPVTVIARK